MKYRGALNFEQLRMFFTLFYLGTSNYQTTAVTSTPSTDGQHHVVTLEATTPKCNLDFLFKEGAFSRNNWNILFTRMED